MSFLPYPIYPRKTLDISHLDILQFFTTSSLHPSTPTNLEKAIEALWSPSQTLTTFTVRTGFDLCLTALSLLQGSEILISCVTIPSMLQIILHHNLIPIPVDIQEDGSVSIQDVVEKITSKTRVVLIAHLFGNLIPHFNEICRAVHQRSREVNDTDKREKIVIFEDCAEAFRGTHFTGCKEADVSMFSFGMIKTCTAFGGGILTVRDPQLLLSARRIQDRFLARQSEGAFLGKVAKCVVFKILTESIYLYGFFIWFLGRIGVDHHAFIRDVSISFRPESLIVDIRKKPSTLLLTLLLQRLRTFNLEALVVRKKRMEEIGERLEQEGISPLGFRQAGMMYWLCPVRVKEPEGFGRAMVAKGWDCAGGGTSLAVCGGGDKDGDGTEKAREIMGSVVYLPLDAAMGGREVDRFVMAVRAVLEGGC